MERGGWAPGAPSLAPRAKLNGGCGGASGFAREEAGRPVSRGGREPTGPKRPSLHMSWPQCAAGLAGLGVAPLSGGWHGGGPSWECGVRGMGLGDRPERESVGGRPGGGGLRVQVEASSWPGESAGWLSWGHPAPFGAAPMARSWAWGVLLRPERVVRVGWPAGGPRRAVCDQGPPVIIREEGEGWSEGEGGSRPGPDSPPFRRHVPISGPQVPGPGGPWGSPCAGEIRLPWPRPIGRGSCGWGGPPQKAPPCWSRGGLGRTPTLHRGPPAA